MADETSSLLWGTGELMSLLGLLADGYSNYQDIDAQAKAENAGWDFQKAQTDYQTESAARANADQRAMTSSAIAMYGGSGAGLEAQKAGSDSEMQRQAAMAQKQFEFQQGQHQRNTDAINRAQTQNTLSTIFGGVGAALNATNSVEENNWFGAKDQSLKGSNPSLTGKRGAAYQYNRKQLWGY
jgi:hypothetical protein